MASADIMHLIAEVNRLRDLLDERDAELAAAQQVAVELKTRAEEIDSERFVAWADRDKAVAELAAEREKTAELQEWLKENGQTIGEFVASNKEAWDRAHKAGAEIERLRAELAAERERADTHSRAALDLTEALSKANAELAAEREEHSRALTLAGKTNLSLMKACEEYQAELTALRAELAALLNKGDNHA